MGMDVRGIKPRLKVDAGNFDYTALAHAGEYFRANVWGWAPIRLICGWMNDHWELELNMEGWQYNDGKGLKTQYECDLLAGALEDIYEYPNEWDEDPFLTNPFFDQFVLYLDAASVLQLARTDRELNLEGVNYSVSGSHYWLWVTFLWNCGGFQIY